MAHIFITGSSDGLGLMAGRLLTEQGHAVTLHARSSARAEGMRDASHDVERVLVGDLSTLAGMRDVAEQANRAARFDAVIHNVGIGYREPRRVETADGLSQLWAVNVLAPYVLTALMHPPRRLIYLSSGMHTGGDPSLRDLQWSERRWNGSQAYADTKLHDVLLAFGVARRWPDVACNVVNPGWVPTKMGGEGAPDDIQQAHRTQAWLAVSDEAAATRSGGYFYHQQPSPLSPHARDTALQDHLLDYCRDRCGIGLPDPAAP
jgi:NAD(P)-dependent dehydrogenase (short-subunit alcohol dehydrogenase family)